MIHSISSCCSRYSCYLTVLQSHIAAVLVSSSYKNLPRLHFLHLACFYLRRPRPLTSSPGTPAPSAELVVCVKSNTSNLHKGFLALCLSITTIIHPCDSNCTVYAWKCSWLRLAILLLLGCRCSADVLRIAWKRRCSGCICVCKWGIAFLLLFTYAARWWCHLRFEIELGAPMAWKLCPGFYRAAGQGTGSRWRWSRRKRGRAESCSRARCSIVPSALWFLICCFVSGSGSWSTVQPAIAFVDSFINHLQDTTRAKWATNQRKEPAQGSTAYCIYTALARRFWNMCKYTGIAEG